MSVGDIIKANKGDVRIRSDRYHQKTQIFKLKYLGSQLIFRKVILFTGKGGLVIGNGPPKSLSKSLASESHFIKRYCTCAAA